jgi:dTDP-4-amino-4,6-dideoxygalactose transaminase
MSLMTGKSFAVGEMGVLVTDNKTYYDRAMAYSHYERNNARYISDAEMLKYASMPLGGMKGRVNQTCAAMGRVQLKYYDERIAEIDRAMNYFWDLLEGVPGLHACRTKKGSGSTMAGWYSAHGVYKAEELGGLPLSVFCDAVKAEGFQISAGANRPLHTHPVFKEYDALGLGKPTRIAFAKRDVRELDLLPITESIQVYSVPWFKKYMPEYIEMYAKAYKKVAYSFKELANTGRAAKDEQGRWFFYRDKDE